MPALNTSRTPPHPTTHGGLPGSLRFYLFTFALSVLKRFSFDDFAIRDGPLLQGVDLQHRDLDPSRIFNIYAKLIVQSIAATAAAISVAATLLVLYWFCRMHKRFRHRLIMLLIFGDLMKSAWYFIFAIASFRHNVDTKTPFCQASGFFIQYGTETCDYAVLVIAVHSALQVFQPGRSARTDGLYHYRKLIYLGGISIPIIMAALAFINPTGGYIAQGAFCTLPLRPYWYRLALAWIPRYLIAIIIMGLAAAIYTVVGFEFRRFARTTGDSTSFSDFTTTPRASTNLDSIDTPAAKVQNVSTSPQIRRNTYWGPDTLHSRRPSVALSIPETILSQRSSADFQKMSTVPFRIDVGAQTDGSDVRPSITSLGTADTSILGESNARRPSVVRIDPDAIHPSDTTPQIAGHSMTGQRARIQRQIRLQFIYPLIYVCMWIFPFTLHCLQYQDRYAQHPPFALSILVVLCLTSMGTVDCLIFSLRERPWRHMPRSDHTFWGSFVCWHGNRHGEYAQGSRQGSHASDVDSRRSSANAGGAVHPTAESSRRVSVFIPRASTAPTAILPGRTFSRYSIRPPKLLSGPTEQEKNAAEMARERLRVEQEDRRQARIRANEKAAIAAAAAVERVALAEEEKKECAGGGVCSQSTGNGRLDLEEISADEKATTGVADRAALSKQEQERDTSGSLYSQSTGGVQLDLEQIEADEETMATVMAGHTALASYAQEEETSGSSYSQSTGGNPRIVELGDTTDGGDSGNETSSMPEKFEEV